jgi:hypothetical protein
VNVLIFLRPFIWSHVSGLLSFRDPTASMHQILCKSRKKFNGGPGKDCTSIGKEFMSLTKVFEYKVKIHRDRKARDLKLIIVLTSRGLFTKNSSWQAKHLIPYTTVTFYADCVKLCGNLVRNLATKELIVALVLRSTIYHTSTIITLSAYTDKSEKWQKEWIFLKDTEVWQMLLYFWRTWMNLH